MDNNKQYSIEVELMNQQFGDSWTDDYIQNQRIAKAKEKVQDLVNFKNEHNRWPSLKSKDMNEKRLALFLKRCRDYINANK